MLFQRQYLWKTSFSGLLTNLFTLFLIKSTLSLQRVNINKMQISLTLAYAITEYEVQRAMFKKAILDFQCENITTDGSHKAFCSTYI